MEWPARLPLVGGGGVSHGPTLSEFLSNLENELDNVYSIWIVCLEVYFNWPLESLKSDKK